MASTYGLKQTVAPALEPVTLSEAKLYLRQDSTADDALIQSYITTARVVVETHTGRQLINATYVWTLDNFYGFPVPGNRLLYGNRPLPQMQGGSIWPYTAALNPPRNPLVSVTSIQYISDTNVLTTLADTEYTVDTYGNPPRIVPAYGKVWPVTLPVPNSVLVTFVAGFGSTAADVPELYKTAMKLLMAMWYENREELGSPQSMVLPIHLRMLLAAGDDGRYP